MAAFDYYVSPEAPKIDISLFGDAASQGIKAGTELPSPVTAAVQGLTTGIETGQKITANEQESQIRQHQISQFPTQDAFQKAQLENEQAVADINRLHAQIGQATEQAQIDATKAKLTTTRDQLNQQAEDLRIQNQITAAAGDPAQNVRLGIFTHPTTRAWILRHPKEGQAIIGSLDSDLKSMPDLRESMQRAVGYGLERQYDKAIALENAKLATKDQADLDKAEGKVRENDDIAKYVTGKSVQDIIALEVAPFGSKNLLPGTNKINPANPNNPVDYTLPQMAQYKGQHQVFANGELIGVLHSDSDANKLGHYQELLKSRAASLRSAMGLPPGKFDSSSPTGTPPGDMTPQTGATSAPRPLVAPARGSATQANPVKILGLGDIVSGAVSGSHGGLSPEEVKPYVEGAANAGYNRSDLADAINSILPPGVNSIKALNLGDRSISEILNTTSDEKAARDMILSHAQTLADETISNLDKGTPDQKAELRDWAEAQGLNRNLDRKELTAFYAKGIQGSLGSAIDQASALGNRAKYNKSLRAPDGTPVTPEPTPTEAVDTAKQARQQDQLKSVQGAIGLGGPASAGVIKKVTAHPLLKDASPDIQALAAIESQGRPGATSDTGVKGLLQVTGGAETDLKNRHPELRSVSRFTPEGSVALGTAQWEDLVRHYKGNKDLAAAAYNSGQGTVDLAVNLAGSEDWSDVKGKMFEAIQTIYKRHKDAYGGKTPGRVLAEVSAYPDRFNAYLTALS